MKKAIISLFFICMMAMAAFALVDYTGSPTMPYIIYGHVEKGGNSVAGAVLKVENKNTGYSTTVVTNSDGAWQQDAMNWQTSSEDRLPIKANDNIVVTVTGGCGAGDVCTKSFYVAGDYKYYAEIDFSVSGETICQPCNCGGGGGGGVAIICTQEKCNEQYPCAVCPPLKECTKEECQEVVCEETPCETECPACEECQECVDTSFLFEILFGLAGLVLGGFGWYAGYKGLISYYAKKGKEAEEAGDKAGAKANYERAAKMVNTAIIKAKEGKYN